jgi:VanZ family protein
MEHRHKTPRRHKKIKERCKFLPTMSEQPHGFTRLSYWIPAVLAALIISGFSTHYFSDEHTSQIIVPVLHWLFPSATSPMLHFMHIGVRKLAHAAEFSLFSAALFHGVRAGRNGWRLRWAVASMVIAATYAGLDEWHQSFVPLRHAAARDVAIDTLGALLAQALVWRYATRKSPFTSPSQIRAGAEKLQ